MLLPSVVAFPVMWLTTCPQVKSATTLTKPATHASEITSRDWRMKVWARLTSMADAGSFDPGRIVQSLRILDGNFPALWRKRMMAQRVVQTGRDASPI